ncbi:MAG: cation:dicarboxylase symporter family transporter [Clostridia bacterium]|nr:cation:dicarboxylase symporter family transporter [Deltaproteobacteria bacterium]
MVVLVGVVTGVLLGWRAPALGAKVKPLADIFVTVIKVFICPIVFCTVALGIASMGDLKRVGRVGIKALVWFELMTTIALVLGLVVSRTLKPGSGMHVDASKLDTSKLDKVIHGATGGARNTLDTALDVLAGIFSGHYMLQTLGVALVLGFVLAGMGRRAAPFVSVFERLAGWMFFGIGAVMLYAPVAAFAAMAFTISTQGVAAIGSLLLVMVAFYATALAFVLLVLGLVTHLLGFSILRVLRFIGDELLLILGTSSSESALPSLMRKLEEVGVQPGVVRLVVPTGYSFNLDGTCIYLTMATSFIAQALDISLSLPNELEILGVLLLTSKGAAGVTGSGFVTLAATLSSVGTIPVAGVTLLLGIDRFMSEARALTNVCGNTVATLVIGRWERAIDMEKAGRVLGRQSRQ